MELPAEFKKRMANRLKGEGDAFFKSYDLPPRRAIRVNTLKISVEDFKKISPFQLEPVPWEPCGFYVEGEGLGKTVLHAAGAYYVQEPSAMSAVPALGVKAGERVLDLCAAPGGKGTQIAQYMNGEGTLVLNETVPSRREILAENVERLGVKNATLTCAPPALLAGIFGEYFDKILVDAPCSGEGMFKKEPNALPEWSPGNVKFCAARQAEILSYADKMLCGGGRMVYSTCTFSEEEDENVVEGFLREHKNYRLADMQKLYPHKVAGEGHFFAVLEKESGDRAEDFPPVMPRLSDKIEKIYRRWEEETLGITVKNIVQAGEKLYFFDGGARDFASALPEKERWRIKNLMPLGTVAQNRANIFVPCHALAAVLRCGDAKAIEADSAAALGYLRGFTVGCPPGERGWRLVSFENLPLGWCKCVDGVAKNHLPKGLRI